MKLKETHEDVESDQPTVLAEAERLHRDGYRIIPIGPGTKKPAGAVADDWPNRVFTFEELPDHFSNGNGIGIVCGHNGAVDIDLDCEDARALAPAVLPPTHRKHGRPGASNSHFWYSADPLPPYKKFVDPSREPSKATIVEVRAEDHQTVVPPSKYPDAEGRYRWDERGEPAHVSGATLTRATELLTALVLVSRCWPSQGSRHDASLALAGVLARRGVPVDVATDMVLVVAELAGDEEAHLRADDVRDTYRRQPDFDTTGLPTLLETLITDEKRKAEISRFFSGSAYAVARDTVEESAETKRQTQALVLMELASAGELFHTPSDEPFIRIPVGNHLEVMAVNSRGSRIGPWLRNAFQVVKGGIPQTTAVSVAIDQLAANATFSAPEHEVYCRVGSVDGKFYLDLANEQWQVIEIDAHGWRVVNDPPIRFRRSNDQLPLPIPVQGGSIEVLRPLVRSATEEDWMLMIGWLLFALCPDGPYPILNLNGERGSAKSTTSRLFRCVIDPSRVPTRDTPKNGQDLAIAARHNWVLAYDNLSEIREWLSDALCRLATGGGYAGRTLYKDDEETSFYYMRPIVLNGIEELATRGDLLDRSIVVTLPRIDSKDRLLDAELNKRFTQVHPLVLGALLDATSYAMANESKTVLPEKPRMVTFAHWVYTAAPFFGWDQGRFLRAYLDNRIQSVATELESSSLAYPIMELVNTMDNGWDGTATELLAKLAERAGEDDVARKCLPKNANRLSAELERVAPALRTTGYEIERSRLGKGGTKLIHLKRGNTQPE
jgi:Bifunctional DNA primase/polymerase, N-terminal